jgi:DNA repair protein REV1
LVSPNWVVDSIKANKLLAWRPYSLFSLHRSANAPSNATATSTCVAPTAARATDRAVGGALNTIIGSGFNNSITKYAASSTAPVVATATAVATSTTAATSNQLALPTVVPDGPPPTITRTARDSEFLDEYYKNSRLHHLSTWKNQFQAQLQTEVSSIIACQALPTTTAADDTTSGAVGRVIFHVDMVCKLIVLAASLPLTRSLGVRQWSL